MIKNILRAGALLLLFSCNESKQVQSTSKLETIDSSKGLKDYYKDYFAVGVAVNMRSLFGEDSALLLREFNSMTPENDLKIGPVHPTEGEYNFRNSDTIIAFAQRHNMRIRGHNLVWHFASQTPKWIFEDKGKEASKELVLQRLKDHIFTVVNRYKGKIYAWDVANEVISDKPGEYLRNSDWYRICGEDYIVKAFQWAHEADPNALLFYNDYNEINPSKREKIFRLVKNLKDAGIPIHGLGLQAHWAISEPSQEQLDSTLKRFSELGVQLHITEMDISVYPKEHNARERKAEDANTAFSAEREQAQIDKYKMCFELFRKYRKQITSVTFWNLSDHYSWLDNFPVQNRKDYPLLFDQNLKRKNAYWEIIKF